MKRKIKGGGDCYYIAGQFAMDNVFSPKKIDYKGTPYLVHAEVQGQGKVSNLRYGHAWIEDDENVYDFSNGRELIIPKVLYYAIGDIKTDNPKKYQKYTFSEARKRMLQYKHYGCWDLDVEYKEGGEVSKKIYHFTESLDSLFSILDSDSLQSGYYNKQFGRGYDNISFTWNPNLWNIKYAGDEEARYKVRISLDYDRMNKEYDFKPFDYGIPEEQEEIVELEEIRPIIPYITEILISIEESFYETNQLKKRFPNLKIKRVNRQKIYSYKNGGEILLAPNGKPSNLNEVQYHLVRTPEFKAWFGDWENSPETASKILDDNGEPLICFHGSNNEFNVFEEKYLGSSNDMGFYGQGFYFTFQKDEKYMKFAVGEAGYYGKIVKPYFIKALNPFIFGELKKYKGISINFLGTQSLVFLNNIAKKFPQLAEKITLDRKAYNPFTEENEIIQAPISILPDLIDKYSEDLKIIEVEDRGEIKINGYLKSKTKEVFYDNTKSGGTKGSYLDFDTLSYGIDGNNKKESIEILLIEAALEKYDGIEVRYNPEGYMTRFPEITDAIKENHDCIMQGETGDELVVFKPTQIKLADGTNTTFDSNNPDIRFAKGGFVKDYEDKKHKVEYSINVWKNPYDSEGYPMNISAYAKIIKDGNEIIIGNLWSYLWDIDKQKKVKINASRLKVFKNIKSNGYSQLLEIEDAKVITEFQRQGIYKNLLKKVLKDKKLPVVSYKWQRNGLSDAFWKKNKDANVVNISSNYIAYPKKTEIRYNHGGNILPKNELIRKMYGWYSSFKDRYYKDLKSAHKDIERVVDFNNKQFGTIFGNDNPKDIINLFNFIETKKGIIVEPKIKQSVSNKKIEYITDSDLVNKEKQIWEYGHGIEIGRYFSKLQYIDTDDSRIYGTEKPKEEKIIKLMNKLKNGDELPPILLDYDFGILDGHHRYEASKRLGIKQIPIIIYEYPDIRYVDGGSIPDLLSSQEVENKLGRKLDWWNDDIVYLSGIEYKKVYLRPEYKKVIE